MKHLSGLGKNWPEFLYMSMLSYNSFSSPNLDGYSPFELLFGRQAKLVPHLEIESTITVSNSYEGAVTKLNGELAYMREHLQKFRNNRLILLNKHRNMTTFTEGQLVYLYQPRGALLQTGSRKIKCDFVGPLVIYKAVSPAQFILMSLDGMIYPHLIEETRIKHGYIKTSQGVAATLADLKTSLRSMDPLKIE